MIWWRRRGRGGGIIPVDMQRKDFFSEEKKQKTFYPLSEPLSKEGRQPVKSFLVLFFKKELLATFAV
jgi:hypothetical protein